MLRVGLNNLRPGMALALPVRHPQSIQIVLLKVGYKVDDLSISKLRELGVNHVWVRYPSLEFLSRLINEELLLAQNKVVEKITASFVAAQQQACADMEFETYADSLTELVTYLASHPQAAMFMGDLVDSGGDLMRHCSSVAYLSLLMGMKLETYIVRERRHVQPAKAKEVVSLGVGAMLHDVGLLALPEEIRNRYTQTGDETDPIYRDHPRLGYQLVRGRVSPSAATAVLNHHQRFDGTGYAGDNVPVLDGRRIHIFARIVGLADQFDRLRHPAVGPARPGVFALAQLMADPLAAGFDPEVMRSLFRVAPPYPPGTVLRLCDGQWGVAINHNVRDPCRPVVQIIPDPATLGDLPETQAEQATSGAKPDAGAKVDAASEAGGAIINLINTPDLWVAQVEGEDVAPMNFPAPTMLAEMTSNPKSW
ncbi:MAG: HD domain-containing protein [Planctomycetota bacterium]|nr:HD domain-containing protein [Planctomycetota bacterium]